MILIVQSLLHLPADWITSDNNIIVAIVDARNKNGPETTKRFKQHTGSWCKVPEKVLRPEAGDSSLCGRVGFVFGSLYRRRYLGISSHAKWVVV